MKHGYPDLLALSNTEPLWYTEDGVPRFAPFEPNLSGDIHADEAVLLLIECQNCGNEFRVCLSTSAIGRMLGAVTGVLTADALRLSGKIQRCAIHYGDPPISSDCCGVGSTMNSVPKRVLEYWTRHSAFEWQRDVTLEIDVTPDWALDED